jgi:pimeloyl-ACP methyl ester carboxylesterase
VLLIAHEVKHCTFVLISAFCICLAVIPVPGCKTNQRSVKELSVQTPDVTLFARAAGHLESGNVLIAVNGGPGLSSHYMLSLERLAGTELAVITYDQRGVSRSTDVPPIPDSFTFQKYVEDLEYVRAASGVETVHLLGHSWGGLVALSYAVAHPERIRSIVLVGCGPPTWDEVRTCFEKIQQRFVELQASGLIPSDLTPGTKEFGEAILAAYFSDPTFWFSSDDEGSAPVQNQQVNQLTWTAVQGYDLTSGLSRLEHRVLVLRGEGDPCEPFAGQAVEEALSSAEIRSVMLKDCGHFWHECPEEFFAAVRPFLYESVTE